PAYQVFMLPASIVTNDVNGMTQTFEYNDYGKIKFWSCKTNSTYDPTTYSAHYSYPDDNTIVVQSEETWIDQKRCYEEVIHLHNGRAVNSEGTFVSYEYGSMRLRKTYRLEYTYMPSNHLNVVKHSEVVGIGEDIKENAWDKAWTWEDYMIWEDGNLKEVQDFQGHSTVERTIKYEYTNHIASYPIVIPIVIGIAHQLPLIMQGVYGSNSVNLVESSSIYDSNGNFQWSYHYAYEMEQDRLTEYTQTTFRNSVFSNPIIYQVNWTEK
ncbi:MAG: hypothetical protein K2L93_06730, partial [Muribaculaceae bacterium]|nr:hypothetical protein [Muribaculaceae bacterium]